MKKNLNKFLCLKFLIFFVFCTKSVYLTSVGLELSLKTKDGKVIEKAGAGVPFVISIKLEEGKISSQVQVKGLEDFQVIGRTFRSSMVNEKISSSNDLIVNCNKIGKYKIGPAKIELDGKVYESNLVEIEVAKEQIPEFEVGNEQANREADDELKAFIRSGFGGRARQNQSRSDGKANERKASRALSKGDIFAKLYVDKQKVVFGEKLNCYLRFYSKEGLDIGLDGVVSPEIKDAKKIEAKSGTTGTQKIDGQMYDYVQWSFSLVPKKIGVLTIPAFRIVYKAPVEPEDDFFGSFMSAMGHNYEVRDLYSNSVQIDVESLPKYNGIVDSVGNFIAFESFADRIVAKKGDGIVYTIELEGQADLDAIEIRELKNIPKELKYYNSKRYILDNSAKEGMKKKRFEFIVQGLSEGEYKLPEQQFTFFDTKTRDYKVLKSKPINIKILDIQEKISGSFDNKKDFNGSESNIENIKEKNNIKKDKKVLTDIMDIKQTGNRQICKDRYISFWLFILIILFPIFLILFIILNKIKFFIEKKYYPEKIKSNAFSTAKKKLKFLESKKDCSKIYQVFIKLFEDRFSSEKFISGISLENIKKILEENNFCEEEIFEFENFLEKVMAISFYKKDRHDSSESDLKDLFGQAYGLVDKLREKLKK